MTNGKTTTPAQAHRYLKHAAGWVTNAELAAHLGITPGLLTPILRPQVDAGDLQRKRCGKGGILHWRIAPPAPAQIFGIPNWPPGFVSKFDSVRLPSHEARVK